VQNVGGEPGLQRVTIFAGLARQLNLFDLVGRSLIASACNR
jgi:hypothetical protein